MQATLAFLDATGASITRMALLAFLVLNAGFVALIVMRRDRSLVDRWTKRLVVADAALLLAAGGAPVASWAAGTAARVAALVLPHAPAAASAEAPVK
jgi:hypothetical protein